MNVPSSLYRLQFRGGMDFARAEGLLPYLSDLGVGALYASPLFRAASGSGHGYDVTDHGAVEPALGGREGLEALSAALRARGMGLVLDIVPNHMAFGVENVWLRDVLRHGAASRYHGHFDWTEDGPVRLPWLPAPLPELEGFAVEDDPDGPVLVREGLRVPIAPGTDGMALSALLDAQPWRLTHWRTEDDAISHRRFFNVTSLIGVRVEEPAVFDDVHALLLDLVRAGTVTGIRIDHVDGLARPGVYLRRLRAAAPDVPIWVEKILTRDEWPPEDWPVEGTTGYVAARQIGRVLTGPDGLARITHGWRDATGRTESFHEALVEAKRQIVEQDLSAELWQLHALASRLMAESEHGPEAIRQGLIAYVIAFPRYRSYGTEADDAAVIRAAGAEAAEAAPAAAEIAEWLVRPEGWPLRRRLQQVTGAAIAKAQEDTAFYRWIPLLSANEVGCEPDEATMTAGAFHDWAAERAARMPRGITLTSSHDTKRSEDARAALVAATHLPAEWEAFAADALGRAPEGLDPTAAWHGAQSALALPEGAPERAARLAEHLVKAMREAKEVTFHADPDAAQEALAEGYAHALADLPVPAGIAALARRIACVQAALKLMLPGVPDLYQGCEVFAPTLTDPDNRRAPDWDALARAEGPKADLTRTLLRLRRERPALFEGYEPLEAPGGVIAFARGGGALGVAVAVGPARMDLPGTPVWGGPDLADGVFVAAR